MRQKAIHGSLALGAWVALTVLGCCKDEPKPPADDPLPVASNDPGVEDPSESHRNSKVDRVTKCFNASMRINQAANHYFQRLRGGKPRVGRTPSIAWKPQKDTAEICEEARTDLTPPMKEIDEIMPRYAALVAGLTKQIDDMDQYYRTKEYDTDRLNKGVAMHEAFKKDHAEFEVLHDRLAHAIDKVADDRDDDAIEKAAKTKGLRYYSLVFLRDAKYLSREITKDKPDPQTFGDLKAKLEQSHTALSNHAGQHPEEVSKAFMFAMYESHAEEFVSAVRDANASRLRDRDLDHMLTKYNSMIDRSNSVVWQP